MSFSSSAIQATTSPWACLLRLKSASTVVLPKPAGACRAAKRRSRTASSRCSSSSRGRWPTSGTGAVTLAVRSQEGKMLDGVLGTVSCRAGPIRANADGDSVTCSHCNCRRAPNTSGAGPWRASGSRRRLARPTLKQPCTGRCRGCRRISRSLLPVPDGQPVTCQWKEHSDRVGGNRVDRRAAVIPAFRPPVAADGRAGTGSGRHPSQVWSGGAPLRQRSRTETSPLVYLMFKFC